ncbi:cell division suppressor protein YneA [Chlamydia abortus]|uniref:LysM peptidoglycan-binding domain-containing protein n=1 Tax=Paenibacillus residui TaxID=629724 RepID=A0ABW3DJD5_9BACL|nr:MULTISPECIES: LysM peptidoglycan-binding domain-containing protein [Paenibacillaceae]SHE12929.1 cell division suppressor protein YneA [Chlamydia abortus]
MKATILPERPVIANKTILRIMLLTVLVFGVISASYSFIFHAYAGDARTGSVAVRKEIDVAPGDTLWSIASKHAPEGESTRSYINKIKKVNQLQSSVLHEGQILFLP